VVRVGVRDDDVADVDAVYGLEERRVDDAGVDQDPRAVERVVEVGVDAPGRDALAREGDPSHYRRSE
jgi:hypothetical protein